MAGTELRIADGGEDMRICFYFYFAIRDSPVVGGPPSPRQPVPPQLHPSESFATDALVAAATSY
jgi:hypothetical protein